MQKYTRLCEILIDYKNSTIKHRNIIYNVAIPFLQDISLRGIFFSDLGRFSMLDEGRECMEGWDKNYYGGVNIALYDIEIDNFFTGPALNSI